MTFKLFIDLLISALFGVVEGITEWLPISSTGHMILLNNIIDFDVDKDFFDMYEVVIQFGAILAVVVVFWKKLWPFCMKVHMTDGGQVKRPGWIPGAFSMWMKIIVSCIPAAIVGLLFDDEIDRLFYHPIPIAIALIVVGIAFIIVESTVGKQDPHMDSIAELTYKAALIIGVFQVIAAIFPGTSRSGATIIGAIVIGVSRQTAAEYTFFLAVPVMLGASLLKLFKFGFAFTPSEAAILIVGMVVSYLVSIIVIKFLMSYIKKHDFKAFGWYRIALGIVVILYFGFAA
ncbi:MAG: undecaprenyl-diphosphate phosphatase [Lachnospiraceae bacterium]|jgi:undecaprenyl-diphosphatase|nr:undecaprenyl-diphosphate phosphatase [Lachnospiraceae bacterium]MEE3461088.1 undecaprenyl-diphosphate phosphatase [Lachnospiraceae bacterium]